MSDAIQAVDEVDKEGGRIIAALNKLLPGISTGSRRRALKRDTEAYEKALQHIELSDLPEEDKELMLARYRHDLLHVDNLSQIAQGAASQINEASSTDDMDPDWIDDFIDKAERISDEDMQRLWSNLLAGEVNTHGAFSKKAMLALYEMDKRTAKIFSRYCTYAVKQRFAHRSQHEFFVVDRGGLDKSGDPILSIEEYQSREDAGLLNQLYISKIVLIPKSATVLYSSRDEEIVLINLGNNQVDIEFGDRILTGVGQVLCELCDWGTAPDLQDVLKSIVPPDVQVYPGPKQSSTNET